MGPRCCCKLCQKSKVRHCSAFTDEDRQEMFSSFWGMDWSQKKVYVSTMVDSAMTKETTTEQESRREQSNSYHMKKSDGRLQVCKSMFLSTSGLGEWTVHHWLSSSKAAGMPSSSAEYTTPKRAKPENAEMREFAHAFFYSLPKLPSHYCRASTSKLYLEPCIRSQVQLFQQNIRLLQPKKDQCDVCCAFEAGHLDDSEYNKHIQKKTHARDEKTMDKER